MNNIWIPFESSFAPAYDDRIYAVGDIHAQGQLMGSAMEAVRTRVHQDKYPINLIFLGDLIDRGPDVFPVLAHVEQARQDPRFRVFVIRGNHERTFERYLQGKLEPREVEDWILLFGGKDTLAACALDWGQAIEWYRKGQRQPTHPLAERLFRFCSECLDFVEFGGVAFVHEPEVGARLLKSGCRGPVRGYVHGHIIVQEVTVLPTRIALDIGSYTTGMVAVLEFAGRAAWYLKLRAD